MKVVHIISGGDTGGAKTSVITLLNKLKEIIKLDLICFMEGEFSKEAREHGINTIVIKQSSRYDLSVNAKLVETINQNDYDLVNCHGARANFIVSSIKNKINIPIITTVHSDYIHDFDNNIYKKIIFTMLNKKSLKAMDYFITMAKSFKNDMVTRGFNGEKIYVAYNGVPLIPIDLNFDKGKYLSNYGITYDEKNTYIGYATRLHPIKGIEVLLEAAKLIKSKNNHVKVLIAGYGDSKLYHKYMDYIEANHLKDTVYFLGFIKEINSFYQSIDINVVSSHSEAVCYSLLEGGRVKKPSIASAVGGITELISHQEDGLLFADNDYETFANEVIDLANKKEFAKELGNNLFKRIESKFSDLAMANRYKEIYEEIISK